MIYDVIRCDVMCCDVIWFDMMRYHTIRYDTVWYNDDLSFADEKSYVKLNICSWNDGCSLQMAFIDSSIDNTIVTKIYRSQILQFIAELTSKFIFLQLQWWMFFADRFNTLRPRKMSAIFQTTLLSSFSCSILISISLKFSPHSSID